jgi:hypothetical protein
VVEHVHPLGVKIDAALDIADEGVLGPAVPQPGHDIEELAGPAVAFAVLHMLGQSEIERRIGVRGRDQVPAGPAAADVVERGETPLQQISSKIARVGCSLRLPRSGSTHQPRRTARAPDSPVLSGRDQASPKFPH